MSDLHNETGWSKWMPGDFRENAINPAPRAPQPEPPRGPSEEMIQEEIGRLRQQAEQKGYADGEQRGYKEGHEKGYNEGFEAGREAGLAQGKEAQQEVIHRLNQLFEEVRLSLDNLDVIIPSRLMQISIEAVHALVGKQISINTEALKQNIDTLLAEEKWLKGDIMLWLNEADKTLLENELADKLAQQGWQIGVDPNILPGSCRVTSAEGELDATLNTRLEALYNLAREECKL